MTKKGRVYIVINPYYTKVTKIGITDTTMEERIKGIIRDTDMEGWEEYYSFESEKYKEIEKHMLAILNCVKMKRHYKTKTEYFDVDPETALELLEATLELVGETTTQSNDNLKKQKNKPLPLTMYAEKGSELVFIRDENIKCKIVDEHYVKYDGKNYSISGLAEKLLKEKFNYTGRVAGTLYFKSNGKLLKDIQKEIYSKLLNTLRNNN